MSIPKEIRFCEWCGKEFETKNKSKRFCRRTCKEHAKVKRLKVLPEQKEREYARKLAIKYLPIKNKKCETCGKKAQHRHHSDYSKPLEITFLCQKCHIEWHKKFKAITGQTNIPFE